MFRHEAINGSVKRFFVPGGPVRLVAGCPVPTSERYGADGKLTHVG
jgi:hypothetical protein